MLSYDHMLSVGAIRVLLCIIYYYYYYYQHGPVSGYARCLLSKHHMMIIDHSSTKYQQLSAVRLAAATAPYSSI